MVAISGKPNQKVNNMSRFSQYIANLAADDLEVATSDDIDFDVKYDLLDQMDAALSDLQLPVMLQNMDPQAAELFLHMVELNNQLRKLS